jgi:hypothetical protein
MPSKPTSQVSMDTTGLMRQIVVVNNNNNNNNNNNDNRGVYVTELAVRDCVHV